MVRCKGQLPVLTSLRVRDGWEKRYPDDGARSLQFPVSGVSASAASCQGQWRASGGRI